MTPLTRLRHYELNRLLARSGWPQVGSAGAPASPALMAAVLGISVSTLRRLEVDPWLVSGRHLWSILRAVHRLGVPWTPDDYFGLTEGRERIELADPTSPNPYEGEPPLHLDDPDEFAPAPLDVPYPIGPNALPPSMVSGEVGDGGEGSE